MKKKIQILVLLFTCVYQLSAQDTLNIMSYNLLNFPTKGTVDRDDTLRKILQYHQPDVLLVCELTNEDGANKILNNSLNVYGTNKYQRANFVSNQSNPSDKLQGMLFYNSDKLTLYSQNVIVTSVRDINEYVLYYNSPLLAQHNDTIFIDFYVAHLKSSQGSVYEIQRWQQAKVFKDYIDAKPADRNRILCGDFNLYTASEPSYRMLTDSGTYKMVDPINQSGNWHNNSSFASIHTQSTRLSDIGDFGSFGGLDDRFDFILVSENIDNAADSISYINNTYKAIGNDGNHYNQSLNNGTNNSVPDSVLNALYYMSDHLPVTLKLKIEVDVAQATPPINTSNTVCSGNHPFFSQVLENGNSKAIELYNPSNSAIDLTNYKLERYSNGGYPNNPATYNFTGFTSLASDDVFVIANSGSDASILAVADVTNSIAGHNGNDAYLLRLISDNSIIDSFGDADNSANNAQQDASLTRKINTSSCPYDTNPTDNFNANDYNITAYNGGSIAGYDLGETASLPVDLQSFTVQLTNKKVLLNWTTATETNNAYFKIQHSTDGKNFETIGTKAGAGTTYEVQEYSFIDESPINGLNYYRLQQVDFDGKFENHKIVSVLTTNKTTEIAIFPTPVSNQFDLIFNEMLDANTPLEIYNINGQLVKSEIINRNRNRQTIDVTNLQAGIYFIRMNINNTMITKRFVKL